MEKKMETWTSSNGVSYVWYTYTQGGDMKIRIKKCKGGWYFKIVARNGRTLCHSEVYKTLESAKKTAARLRDVMVGVGIVEDK